MLAFSTNNLVNILKKRKVNVIFDGLKNFLYMTSRYYGVIMLQRVTAILWARGITASVTCATTRITVWWPAGVSVRKTWAGLDASAVSPDTGTSRRPGA